MAPFLWCVWSFRLLGESPEILRVASESVASELV